MNLNSLFLLLMILPLTAVSQYDSNVSKTFTNLDDALMDPTRVYKLDLSSQGLDKIPEEIALLNNLVELNLSNNQIKALGPELKENRELEILNLGNNVISEVDFNQLASVGLNLVILNLRHNLISSIDSSLNELRFLHTLDLGDNQIKSIDPVCQLDYLKLLQLDNNQLSLFPSFVLNCKRLKILNLNANNIEKVDVLNLNNLLALDIGDNPLSLFNVTISQLDKIIFDWIDFSNLKLLPLPKTIEILSMEHCKLDHIPSFIYELNKLEELSLMHNNISIVEKEILQLSKLKYLWVGGNAPSLDLAYKKEARNPTFELISK